MAQQTMTGRSSRGGQSVAAAAPPFLVRGVGALLALAVAAVHVADQGGVRALASPQWLGWGYRLIEVGGLLTAAVLVLPLPARLRPDVVGWLAAALLAAGPFAGYLTSRTVGVPADRADVGNWGDWLGTVSLLVEAALLTLSLGMLLALRRRPTVERQADHGQRAGEHDHRPHAHDACGGADMTASDGTLGDGRGPIRVRSGSPGVVRSQRSE